MPTSHPAFSVVIPLYNTERYIAGTLDSVLAQTFADFEVVVVNDASTDSGPSIVERYAKQDSRIRMITQANRGLAGARNGGIRVARGSYIALIDADDLWLTDKLALHFAHLDANPHVGVSFDPSLFIDEHGTPLGLAQSPKLRDIDADHIFCRNPVGNGSAAVMRRAALDDIEFHIDTPEGRRSCWFDESFRQSEDIELWTRIAATTHWKFQGIPQPLTLYRVNTTGLSADVKKQLASWERFRDKLAGYAPELVKRSGRRSQAYQFRYLARRAAMNGQGREAFLLALRSSLTYPRIVVEEPRRTIKSLGFSLLAAVLPRAGFEALKKLVFSATPQARPLTVKA